MFVGGVSAAPKLQIGKIDLKSVVLLHPGMRNYDPYKQAFKVDPLKVPQELMKQKAKEHKEEIHTLKAESRLLRGRIHELRRKHDRDIDKLLTNYLDEIESLATGPRALKRKKYEIAKNLTESAFYAKLRSLGIKLDQTDSRISKLERISYNVGYTDPEETQKRFNAIINEIRQYTSQIASQKGIDVVLNSKSRDLKYLIKKERIVLAPDLDYAKIFNMPFPENLKTDSAAVAGYYQNLTTLAANWLHHGSKILQPFSAEILENDIFIGGTDLTAEVIAKIFRRYKIDAHIGNAVIQSLHVSCP